MAQIKRNIINLKTINNLTAEIRRKFGTAQQGIEQAFKHVTFDDSQIKLYRTPDTSGTPVVIDLPAEYFLDQAKTEFIEEFDWDTFKAAHTGEVSNLADYEDTTEHQDLVDKIAAMDGKPVMVLAVKGQQLKDKDDNADDVVSISYSFIDVSKLVDTYSAKNETGNNSIYNNSIELHVEGYEISAKVKISEADGNLLEVKDDGLYVKDTTVEGAVEDNITTFGQDGVFQDSGVSINDVLQQKDIVELSAAQIAIMLGDAQYEEYADGANYTAGQIVKEGSKLYIAKANMTAGASFDASQFDEVEAYAVGTEYEVGDKVVYDDLVYEAVDVFEAASFADEPWVVVA